MSEQLGDIISKRPINLPPEIAAIKKFVRTKFQSDVSVAVSNKVITIVAGNASLAGALRLELHNLAKDLKTNKKLIIRIG